MQSHFGGLALDVPQQQRGLNEKKTTETESNDTNISKAKRHWARGLGGWRVPGGNVIPGSRIGWLQEGGMLLTARRREGGKKGKGRKNKRERKRVQHPYCAELKGCRMSCLFLQFFNRGGTSSLQYLYFPGAAPTVFQYKCNVVNWNQ